MKQLVYLVYLLYFINFNSILAKGLGENSCNDLPLEITAGDVFDDKGNLVHQVSSSKSFPEKIAVWKDILSQKVQPGSVVIVSEIHDYAPQQTNQLQTYLALQSIAKENEARAHVGMEFLYYDNNEAISHYGKTMSQLLRQKEKDPSVIKEVDEDFQKQVEWSSRYFNNYKNIIVAPYFKNSETVGLNLPRSIVSKVRTSGLESLSENEKHYVPNSFQLGNDMYKERFLEIIQNGHEPFPEDPDERKRVIDHFFQAQSLWDEVMATQIKNFMDENPNDILLVTVGSFHTDFGGGLIDRMTSLGIKNIVNVAQRSLMFHTVKGIRSHWICHPRYGRRANYVVVTD